MAPSFQGLINHLSGLWSDKSGLEYSFQHHHGDVFCMGSKGHDCPLDPDVPFLLPLFSCLLLLSLLAPLHLHPPQVAWLSLAPEQQVSGPHLQAPKWQWLEMLTQQTLIYLTGQGCE